MISAKLRSIPAVAPEWNETGSFMIQKESPSGELQAISQKSIIRT
jgi:hypothetical protein